ncbi:TonB-dependent receptor [Caulobacter sp. 602-1]|uniref:TonB-dependent receptor n=1 Tax=Caulobacter sp. 602-1 TaxID=2492472 RepID=UPI000F634BFA|nr:TonB-dependent receptor [Caulobacter sp. 602-1]RRN66493.1 TonB-dependent receptor [Caulobacter sp. 602-1]
MLLLWFQAATSAEAAQKVESIVVTARPAQVRDKIDRRIYDVRSDGGSQGGVALDVLNRIPSVTVSPTGRIALRGDPGVQILINGKPPPTGTSVLQSLPASSVGSVEVMTNPSAQFSPDGAAGIINIVTHRERALGVSGTISARADTREQASASASASAAQGDWSVDGRIYLGHSPSENDADYTQRDAATGERLVSRDSHGKSTLDLVQASLGVTRRLAEDRELSVEAHHMGGRIRANDLAHYQAFGDGAPVQSEEAGTQRYTTRTDDIEASYSDTWPDDRGSLEANLSHAQSDNRTRTNHDDRQVSPTPLVQHYGDTKRARGPDDQAKVAVVANLAGGVILTTGLEANRVAREISRIYDGDIGALGLASGDLGVFNARRASLSGYATYQFPFAGFKLMPGLRVEAESLRLSAPSASRDRDATRLFPSLHLTHTLAGGKLKASYSRRILRPELELFDPRRIPANLHSAMLGNLDLASTLTDSYESGYERIFGKATLGLTAYYRISHHPWQSYTTWNPDLTTASRPLNYGRATSGGLEANARGEAPGGWKYVVNLNVFRQELIPVTATLATTTRTNYSGNAVVDKVLKNGDKLQFNLSGVGKTYTLQGYQAAYGQLDATWSHKLNALYSVTVNATDIFNTNRQHSRYRDGGVVIDSDLAPNSRAVRVSLVYKFKAKV